MPNERHRPRFHLSASHGWLNDPNGPILHDGVYHLFAQHNPAGPVHGNIHWAHWTSPDLFSWTEEPIALTPVPGSADEDGCWSGSAVEVDGELLLVYSGFRSGDRFQSVCVARPAADGRWVADPEPVLLAPPAEVDAALMRDPFVWRDGDAFRMLLGSGTTAGVPAAIVFSSTDLAHWEYSGPLLDGSDPVFASAYTGQGWECPQLLRAGDRGLLVMSSWAPPAELGGVFWVAGLLDGTRLSADSFGRLDHGPDYYAADLLVDGSGTAVNWAWSWEARGPEASSDAGWAGVLTAPRRVHLADDGMPLVAPILPDLGDGVAIELGRDRDHGPVTDVGSDCVAIAATLSPVSGDVAWLRVLVSPDGAEFTEIGFDRAAGEVYLDRSSAGDGAAGRHSIPLPTGLDAVEVEVVVDVSIVEVFAVGRSLTARVYPRSPTSHGIALGADSAGGRVAASVRRLPAWRAERR